MGRLLNKMLYSGLLLSLLARPTLQYTHFTDEDPTSCDIIGDPDVYGIGVRISFYLNWAAAFVALVFNMEEEAKGVRRAIVAVGVAVVTNTLINATKGSFANLEWYIIFNLVVFLPLWVTVPSSVKALREDIIGVCALWLLWGIYLVVQPWLYFVIPRQGYRDGCPAQVFLYGHFSMYNVHWVGFTKFSAITAVFSGAVVIVTACCGVVMGLIDGLIRGEKKKEDDEEEAKEGGEQGEGHRGEARADHHGEAGEGHHGAAAAGEHGEAREGEAQEESPRRHATTHRRRRPLSFAFSVDSDDSDDDDDDWAIMKKIGMVISKLVLGLSGASTIAFVEETIRVNHIDLSDAPLSETNQLIPFTVGLIVFGAVVWNTIKRKIQGQEKEEDE